MEATKAKGAYIGIKAKNKRAIDSIEKEIYGIDNIRIKKNLRIFILWEKKEH